MFENGFGPFSGQKASVDFDGTLVGHEIDLDAAVDDADVGGGGAEQGVRVLGELARIGFDGLDDSGHHGDGVDPEMRFRAVGGTAVCVDFPAQHAFARDDGPHPRRFRDECGHGLRTTGLAEPFAERDDAAKAVFFVHCRAEPKIQRGRFVRAGDGFDRMKHSGKPALGVATPASVEMSVRDDGIKRRNGHALDAHGIGVRLEDDAAGPVSSGDFREDVWATGKDFVRFGFNAERLEAIENPVCDCALARTSLVSWVDAVDSDELCEEFDDVGGARGLAHLVTDFF